MISRRAVGRPFLMVFSRPVGIARYLQFLVTKEDQAKMNDVGVPCLFKEAQQALNRASVLHHESFLRYRAEINLEAKVRELAKNRTRIIFLASNTKKLSRAFRMS